MRKYITLILLIIVAALSLWFEKDSDKKPDTDSQSDRRFPDYFLENFSITGLNKQGLPGYTLKARKMLHFADDDSAELEAPLLTFNDAENNFTLRANNALFSQKDNTFILSNNVVIHRAATKTRSELSIYTDYLKIDTESRIAETDRAARVKTREAELNTVGLIFDDIQGILKLKSQVKGVYEASH